MKTPTCAYCGDGEDLTVDHVVPISRWREVGMKRRVLDNPSNRVTACRKCNLEKGNMLPGRWLKRHPEYKNHFLSEARFLSDAVKAIIAAGVREENDTKAIGGFSRAECKLRAVSVRENRANIWARHILDSQSSPNIGVQATRSLAAPVWQRPTPYCYALSKR